jgi:hypothetical protein
MFDRYQHKAEEHDSFLDKIRAVKVGQKDHDC